MCVELNILPILKLTMLLKNLIMQCDIILIIFAYQTKLNISGRKRVLQIFYQRGYMVVLIDLCNAIKKRLGGILCYMFLRLITNTLQFLSHDSVFYVIIIKVHIRNKVSRRFLLRTTV